ncbi:isoprenoid biosynthesis glyoxalase ElbB [Anaplasmataceae bacterium AB001_6]|nr:isoprenoid biosynthesis glyoxalase ElbB [Anaplasmataceae bacterium AB001_6]
MIKKVAVILAGCGYLDGTEITEAVLSLTSLEMDDISYDIFSPDDTEDTMNHTDNSAQNEKRNILVESARISRGKVMAISELNTEKYEALFIPGGYGIMKHFTNYFDDPKEIKFSHEIDKILKNFYNAKKVICAVCISPLLVTLALKEVCSDKIEVTIGEDNDKLIKNAGAINISLSSDKYHYDSKNRILSSPAYMQSENRAEIFVGIRGMVNKLRSFY